MLGGVTGNCDKHELGFAISRSGISENRETFLEQRGKNGITFKVALRQELCKKCNFESIYSPAMLKSYGFGGHFQDLEFVVVAGGAMQNEPDVRVQFCGIRNAGNNGGWTVISAHGVNRNDDTFGVCWVLIGLSRHAKA